MTTNTSTTRTSRLAIGAVALALLVAGCGGDESGAPGEGAAARIEVDGSSTVGPLVMAAAERFREERPDVQVTVGISGTGGGFERFCRGEIDLANASRPMKDEEREACERAGVEHVELEVAIDALTVVTSRENDWVRCLTTEQLAAIWAPGSAVSSWRDVDPSFPDEEVELFGPGTDSGTFDYFTAAINGEEGASRSDYAASEDDNVIVQGVAGERGGLGYLGFSYYEENQDLLRAVEIDGGDGCVAPSVETAQSGAYAPLARPLFVYARRVALERPEVADFLRFLLEHEREIAAAARFVPLDEERLAAARRALDAALGGS
jgi:phosphate transport system substrate-binding protein